MPRQICSATLLILSPYFLASCSGVPNGGCVANCGGNNAAVSFVLTATPPAPTSQLSIQAFTATITGVTLTPSTGSAVNIPLNSSAYVAEFTRVTSDSTVLIANVSVPPGTYTQAAITFSAPRVTFCTQADPGVPGCAAGTLATMSGSAGSATMSTNVTLAASQQTGFAVNADLGAALTTSGQTVTGVSLTAANVFTLNTLPPASSATDLSSGQLSHVDDVMGLVTSASGTTLTLQTASRGSITAVANSSTQYDATNCASHDFSCVQANAVAIVDTILNADGSFTLTYYDPLTPSSEDVIEGVVTGVPDSVNNQFIVAVTDSVFAGSSSIINGQLHLGDQIVVSLVTPNPFQIISKGLQIPAGSAFLNSTSAGSILPGQTVALIPQTFSAQSGATLGTASTADLALRFTRITGVAAAVSSPTFSAAAFPPYFGLAVAQQFQTTNGRLSLDGISSLSSLSNGGTFSATALYLGSPSSPQFSAQAVRAH
ncbi:MAG TPA: hypothetical protein VGF20_15630 [Candidatus Acidoferrum sp.]